MTNPTDAATRCLNAAANLDDDESASPTELAAIAITIAESLFDDAAPIRSMILDMLALHECDIEGSGA